MHKSVQECRSRTCRQIQHSPPWHHPESSLHFWCFLRSLCPLSLASSALGGSRFVCVKCPHEHSAVQPNRCADAQRPFFREALGLMKLGTLQKMVVWLAALLSLLLALLYAVILVDMHPRDKSLLALTSIALIGFAVLLIRLNKYAVALSWALAAMAALSGFVGSMPPEHGGGHDIGPLSIGLAVMGSVYVAILLPAIVAPILSSSWIRLGSTSGRPRTPGESMQIERHPWFKSMTVALAFVSTLSLFNAANVGVQSIFDFSGIALNTTRSVASWVVLFLCWFSMQRLYAGLFWLLALMFKPEWVGVATRQFASSMKPSLRAIIWNDWPALACSIGAPTIWAIFFGYALVQRPLTADPFVVFLSAISTAALLGVLAWRIWRIYAMFARGIEVPGHVALFRLAKDRGRLEYAYQFGGYPASSWSPVHQTKRVLSLQVGQQVQVLVDPMNPGRAILKELYV